MPFESSCLPNIRRRSRWLKILPNDCPRKPFCLFALSRTVLFRAPWIFFVLWENHGSRFSDKRVTMVVCPVDGRYGFYALSDLAFKLLHIDIYKQEDYVVFVSRSRGICKIICTDECGTTLITRKLHKGRFERLLMQAQGPAAMTVTPQMLADFINGKPLFVKRESLWQG